MSTQNIFTIERTTGVVTATQNPLLVYNDVIPISVAFTNSAVVDETLMPRRAALSVSLRLGSASGVIIAQAIQFSHAAGYASATLQLSPESQDRVYLSDGVVWLEFNLSEKTGPSSKHTIESEINTASAGGVADLVDAALTGTTSVQVLSPDIADLGTVASGTVTLSSTKAVNKVTLSGSAATIALPSSPPDGWRSLVATITGNVALTVTTPSLYRIDDPALGEVSSVAISAATAGKVIFSFLAIGGVYVGFTVVGDDAQIPSSKLAGLSADGTFAGASAEVFPSQTAVAAYVAALLDALTLPYTDITALTQGSFLTRGTAGTGAAELGTFGAGLSFNPTTRVLTATNTGTTTPIEITGTDIDWAAGGVFTDTIGANTTYTFSNTTDGQVIRILLTASGAYTATWPTNVYGAPTQTSTATDLYQFIRFGAYIICSRLSAGMTIDTAAPTYTSSTIPTDGLTVVDTYNEALHATVATTTGRTLTVNGVSITCSSPVVSGSTVTWTPSSTIQAGTVSANAYTAPGTGIKDLAGNYAATYTGRQADVTNNSTVSTYLLSTDFEGTGTPTDWSSTGTVNWGDTSSPLVGSKSLTIAGAAAGTAVATLASDQSELNFFFYFSPGGHVNGTVLELLNNANAIQLRIEYRSTGWRTEHGTHVGGSGAGPTVNPGVLWGRYVAESGGGGNGIITLHWNDNSSSETKPGSSLLNATAGTGDAVRKIRLLTPGASGGGTTYRVDKVRVASTTIGSNPA